MNICNLGNKIKKRETPNDVVYTPKKLAELMISFCDIKENDLVLDCCKGAGVFYNNYPKNCLKEWCEITEDRDFFKYNKKVAWICSNPPYSLWTSWLKHTMEICDNFCYVFGQMNLTTSRLKMIEDAGFIMTKIHIVKVRWWFGCSFICVFKRGNKKDSVISVSDKHFFCDICNLSTCMRGKWQQVKGVRKKRGSNDCSNLNRIKNI